MFSSVPFNWKHGSLDRTASLKIPTPSGDRLIAIEVEIVRVHADSSILVPGETDPIDPDKCRPLIMSFQHFYGLTPRLQPSRLATIPESAYRVTVSEQQTEESKFVRIE